MEPWFDQWCLVPGRPWQAMIAAGLADSAACAVFVGAAALGPWESMEVDVAIDRAVNDRRFRVIPVILPGVGPFDPSELHPFLATRTWVDFRPGVGDQRALQNLIQAIRGIPFGSEPADSGSDSEVRPFRGLGPFGEAQAEYFFGRENELQRLVEQFRTSRLVAVGPSGSGKSSLVRAGLVSRIRANGLPGSDRWKILVIRPGGEPVTALAAVDRRPPRHR